MTIAGSSLNRYPWQLGQVATRFITIESHPSQTLYRFGSSAILAALAARSASDMVHNMQKARSESKFAVHSSPFAVHRLEAGWSFARRPMCRYTDFMFFSEDFPRTALLA